MKRKIILNLAVSLDGFITDEEGGYTWITGDGDRSHDTDDRFDFEEFMEAVDTLVMGRKAFEDCPAETLKTFSGKTIHVATSGKHESRYDNVKFFGGDVCEYLLKLREKRGSNLWIWGGALLADHFIKADIIDEYIIGIVPLLLGKGRPLFLENNPMIRLHLTEASVQEGIVILRYDKR